MPRPSTTIRSSARNTQTACRRSSSSILRVDKRWIFNRWMLNAYLDLENVFNRANPEAMQYNYDYTKEAGARGTSPLSHHRIAGEF